MPSKQKISDSSVTYKLLHPVELGSERTTQIILSRPKGKHIKHLKKDLTLGEIMQVAQKVADCSPLVFEEMDGGDYLAVGEIVGDFLDSGQRDGMKN